VRSLLRRGQAVASAFSRSRRLRRHAVTTALLASVLALAFTVAAEASGYSQPVAGDTSETITSPSTTTTPTDGTDLPTSSSAYNSAWQSAPAGYITPSNDGLGTTPGQIKHVWEIVLENHAFSSNFTPLEGTENSYAASLPSQGALLTNYYGTGHSSLDNYISLASGQAPMSDDQDDCPSYNEADGSVDETGTLASNSDFRRCSTSSSRRVSAGRFMRRISAAAFRLPATAAAHSVLRTLVRMQVAWPLLTTPRTAVHRRPHRRRHRIGTEPTPHLIRALRPTILARTASTCPAVTPAVTSTWPSTTPCRGSTR
jgi:hypothetical protein